MINDDEGHLKPEAAQGANGLTERLRRSAAKTQDFKNESLASTLEHGIYSDPRFSKPKDLLQT